MHNCDLEVVYRAILGDREREPDFAWENDHHLTLETGDASQGPKVTVASGIGTTTADLIPV